MCVFFSSSFTTFGNEISFSYVVIYLRLFIYSYFRVKATNKRMSTITGECQIYAGRVEFFNVQTVIPDKKK